MDCFIRGLDNPLCFLLKNNNPSNLNAAYNYCLEYCNINLRSAPFKSEPRFNHIPKPRDLYTPPSRRTGYYSQNYPEPPLPPRNFSNQGQNFHPRNNFPPQYSHTRNHTNREYIGPANQYGQNINIPNNYNIRKNPAEQNNNGYPVPMEVDPSIRSKSLNYANRSQERKGTGQQRQTYAVDARLDYVAGAPPLNETEINGNLRPTYEPTNSMYQEENHFLDWAAKW